MKTIHSNTLSALTIIVSATIFFLACKKLNSIGANPPSEILVTGSIEGRVTDLNNAPISGASVTAGSSATTTDINGQFSIKNAQLNKNAGFVKVTMNGYFNGSRTFLVNTNTVNNLNIQLIPKTLTGTFAASSGGTINIAGEGSVNFLTNSIVDATTNDAYSSDVSVSTFYLDPAEANFNEFMPGDLRGVNTSNPQSILRVFGMLLVELNDAAGNKLQIAPGKTATITIPISSAMQANAPTVVPLWYFDDTNGLWKQQGSATKQGNTYVGTVAHFSFWTAGVLGQSIKLDAKFVFDTGSVIFPVANRLVTIASANYGTTIGYTDSAGTVSGLVPVNEILAMKVLNSCGDSIYGKNIGPFTTDTNLGTLTVISNTCYYPPTTIALSATLKDQNGNILVGNSVSITNTTFSDTSINTNSAGQFSVVVPLGQLFVINAYNKCGGVALTQNIGPFTTDTNLGTITITVTPVVSVTLSGTVVDCNNNPVTGGSVYANVGNDQFASSIANGQFSITFNRCSSSPAPVTFIVFDVATGQNIIEPPITVTNGNQNIGQIIIPCSVPLPDSSYINLLLHDVTYSWIYPNDSLAGERIDSGAAHNTFIHGGVAASNPTKYILLGVINDNASPGTYNLSFYANINDSTYKSGGLTTTVTEYGALGGYISGTASGQVLLLPDSTYYPFSCSYRVKRTQ